MSLIQKTIKYLAITLALFLSVNIISTIASCLDFISDISGQKNHSEMIEEIKDLEVDKNAKSLDINIMNTSLIVKIGDTLKIKTSNKYIECKQDNGNISITERKHNLFDTNDENILIIYIPQNIILDIVKINSGAGKIEIEELSTRILELDIGAGNVNIDRINVLNNTKIEGGAGKLTINDSNLNNLDLDLGVGEFTFIGKLSGKSKINSDIGEVKIELLGTKNDYQIHLDKGLGTTKIAEQNIKEDTTIGNGINEIDIEGGIGSINIDFIDNKY